MIDHEHKEATALIKWRDLHLGKYPCLKKMIHIPNGGMRNMKVAKKLKAEGTKAGVSDYLLPVPRHYMHYHGLWVELKAGKNKPTALQYEWLNDMRDEGYAAFWCSGWEEATKIILAYLNNEEIPGRDPKPRGTYKLPEGY